MISGVVDLVVIVVAHNAHADLPQCLASVHRHLGGCSLELVVVDSGSTDDSVEIATLFGATAIACANVGYGAGVNVGRRATHAARYLLILNPDAEIVGGSLERLVKYADANPGIAAFAPQVVNGENQPVASTGPFEKPWRQLADRIAGHPLNFRWEPVDRRRPFGWASGCALVVRAECFDAIGGFDERFFLYADELDLLRSMYARGWQLETYPELVICHHTGRGVVSQRLFKQMFRANLYYAKKWTGPAGLIITRAALSLELVRRLLFNERDAWTPLYRAALRTVLAEPVSNDPVLARELQRVRTLGPSATDDRSR